MILKQFYLNCLAHASYLIGDEHSGIAAVVDHVGHEHTRVFRSVADLSARYARLNEIIGSETKSEVALIYDWETRWAFEASEGVRSGGDGWAVGERAPREAYVEVALDHYAPFARHGVSVDVIGAAKEMFDEDGELTKF